MDNIFSGSSGHPGESEEMFGADQWAFGYSAALQSLDVHPDPQMSGPPMNGQPSQGFSIDNNHVSQDAPTLKAQRPRKKGKVARRGTAFTNEEDIVVCSAFLNISKDPITGVNQTSGGYYKRMHESEKQDQQMAEILSRKDEKIKIQRDLFDLQKKHMKMSMQQQKKENKIREKESEAQLITAEASIMSVDIEKVSAYLKNYYLGMQQKIMESRGFIGPSNNED
ncbi:uncharacterized protein [Miscanthus floridulus]|uniref:uncharacterized protein isoform X2 n=1 Tax=Miscanthus floridulus TaxID=154761 RepID=UPI0034583360